ncbi:MAG: FtsX-like permease family protein [Acidobacteriota bacterium]
MLPVLSFITLRQWRAHKLRTVLTILSISLGVAVFFAVLTANITLLGSLKLTIEKLAGKATLQITSSESGFPEEILETVRNTSGVKIAEPVIEVIAHTAFTGEPNLMIVGVDTAGDGKLREYEFDESLTEIGDPLVYIAQPNSILISRKFAAAHNLQEGDSLPLFTSEGRQDFIVRGIFKPTGIGDIFDGQIALMDVYATQHIFNRGPNFDRIDIMTDDNITVDEVVKKLREQLPAGIKITRPTTRGESVENSVAGMSLGMTVTSFIALLVGVFIIFNSFTISLNQRWRELAILRSLGVERANIAKMVLSEALLMGIIGALAGVVLGFYFAYAATDFMRLMSAQIYGLAATSTAPIFRFDYAIIAFSAGIVATLLAAWLPARIASRLNVVQALHNVEIGRREAVIGWKRIIIGIGLVSAGLLFIHFTTPKVGMTFQFVYSFMMTFGMILILPKFSQWIARVFRPILDRIFGSEGILAVDTMIQSPRRTSATVGALMISLMFVFSTGAYIYSLKLTVLRTMERTVNADFFVAASEMARSRTYHFDEGLGKRIAALPQVKCLENVRFTFAPYGGDEVALVAIEMAGWLARVEHPLEDGDEKEVRELMPQGAGFLVSRNFSARWNLQRGDKLRLETPRGALERPILGVVEDFSSEKGTVMMERALYKEYWQDSAVDFIDINLKPSVDQDAFKHQLQQLIANEQRAFIYTNREYHQHIIDLIDGFFILNYLQMVIAIFVASIGIFNTLVISVSERFREIGVLRAMGGLRRQVRKLILLEAVVIAITGLIAGALLGVFNAYFLVRVAATMIGGFIIPLHFPANLILITFPIVLVVALVAAWWPARRAVNLNIVEAIGYE